MSKEPVAHSRVRIKICGLTRVDEALACVAAGADWIGLNFHPASPRFVPRPVARDIIAAIPLPARAVGLFVNRPALEVAGVAEELGLKIVQLHGDEPPEDLLVLDRFLVIRAFRLGNESDVQGLKSFLAETFRIGRSPDAILVDARVAGQSGGTGKTVAEDLLDLLPAHERLILAGGLTLHNVGARISRYHPWMVDVASGVESKPGRKDPERVRAFIEAARSGP
jgi:phosphoribosylanthranilate isomerase